MICYGDLYTRKTVSRFVAARDLLVYDLIEYLLVPLHSLYCRNGLCYRHFAAFYRLHRINSRGRNCIMTIEIRYYSTAFVYIEAVTVL